MERIITYDLSENIIEKISDYIEKNFDIKEMDLNRLCFVFEGKRPSLFIKRELAKRIGKSYISPKFFSIEEFIKYIIDKNYSYKKISELDACFIIYTITKKYFPDILKNKEIFTMFLPWAHELLNFIDYLDMELVDIKSLKNIQSVANIGYDVPEDINKLLQNIVKLREEYHNELKTRNQYSHGMMYLIAVESVNKTVFDEFDRIFFCNFFYLNKAEQFIIKSIYDRDKAILFFQGNQNDWSILENNAKLFSTKIIPQNISKPNYTIKIYSAFDIHSQVCMTRKILEEIKYKNINDIDKTVIVVPDPQVLLPLLCETSTVIDEINISLGYPLKNNPIYALLKSIFNAQSTKTDNKYRTKDYLKVLTNPVIKNLYVTSGTEISTTENSMITRIVIQKIEDILVRDSKTELICGNVLVNLKEIENSKELYSLILDEIGNTVIKIDINKLYSLVKELHNILFYSWEKIDNFYIFSNQIKTFLSVLIEKSLLRNYPLNAIVFDRIFVILNELENTLFNKEVFNNEDIFKIFDDILDNEFISFSGSPLKGLQILGFLETRSLCFDNVIIMDVNESVLPKLRIYEPLIPRDVMLDLKLGLIEKEQEIQKYYFKRLISAAKNVYLIYRNDGDKERSRFIEEIIWENQKQEKNLNAILIPEINFNTEFIIQKTKINKDKNVIDYLKNIKYSASSLDTYLDCSLKFYYKYVLHLEEQESLLDEPEAIDIGFFIHELLNEVFTIIKNREFKIDIKFKNYFNDIFEKRFDQYFTKRFQASSFLIKEVMKYRMSKFLDLEKERENEVSEIIDLEKNFEFKMNFGENIFNFNGKIDRIDLLHDKSILVIDYKTGNVDKISTKFEELENLELTKESIREIIKSFQLPLYLYFMTKKYKDRNINVGFYLLKEPKLKKLIDEKILIDINKIKRIINTVKKSIEYVIFNEILNPDIPFEPDIENNSTCKIENCPFFYLCHH